MVKIQFETDNDAFVDLRVEIARILKELADKIENGSQTAGGIYDINGNKVGGWKVVQVQQ